MTSTSILFEIKNGIGSIVLNRPEVFNCFNQEMALSMQHALDTCQENREIRCVLITGKGKAFCSGQDLKEVVDPQGPTLQNIVGEHYNPIIKKMRNLRKPVVVAVNGVAAGAGANIALAGDIVLAAHSASFIQAFSKIGLIPDSGGTYTLPRLVGTQRAMAWMMLGDRIGAEEAQRAGMIYKCITDETLEEEAWEMCMRLASMPTKALAFTKMALFASALNTMEEQLSLEEQLQTLCGTTHDYQEGVNAFLEKRAPLFKGE